MILTLNTVEMNEGKHIRQIMNRTLNSFVEFQNEASLHHGIYCIC